MDAIKSVKKICLILIVTFVTLSSLAASAANFYYSGGRYGPGQAACALANGGPACFWSSPYYTIGWVDYFYTNGTVSIPNYVAEEWQLVNGQYTLIPPPSCEAPEVWNPVNSICSMCATGQFDSLSGQCLQIADTCTGMSIYDIINNTVTGCSAPQTCTSPTGSLTYDPTFDFCQDYADACAATGGVYGAVGSESKNNHVCITQNPTTLAQCTAVSLYDDGSGQYGAACTSKNVPNTTCDTTLYDCDGDGKIDDQNANGCIDNGVSDGLCVGSKTGQAPPAVPTTNVGASDFATASKGQGQCDPTSKNYTQCIGGNDTKDTVEGLKGIQDAIEAGQSSLDVPIDTDLFTSAQGTQIGDAFFTRLGAVPIVSAISRSTVFTGAAVCPSPSFSIFGTSFSINYHCTLYGSISGILTALMIALYSIVGLRHVMSA
jgi:hypothetical protein